MSMLNLMPIRYLLYATLFLIFYFEDKALSVILWAREKNKISNITTGAEVSAALPTLSLRARDIKNPLYIVIYKK